MTTTTSQPFMTVISAEYDRLRYKADRYDELERELAHRKAAHTDLEREFDAYKAKVRERAIQCAEDENWCAEGLNAALRELGLEPRTFTYEVRLDLRATQTVYVSVEAENDDAAYDLAQDMTSDDYGHLVQSGEWDVVVEEVTV